MNNRILMAAISTAGVFLGGCIWMNPTPAPLQTPPYAAVRRVEMVNLTTRTQAANPSSLNAEQFVAKAVELYRDGKLGRLHRLVERYPDVALEMLRTTSPQLAGKEERLALAQAYDRLFVAQRESQGWYFILKDMAAWPETHQAAYDSRCRIRMLIEKGQFSEATTLDAAGTPTLPSYLRSDALRVRGIACLLNNQPAQAVATWQQARQLAQTDAGVSAELDLLISDALRRAGQGAESAAAWAQAASECVEVHDPIFWERLLELKPAHAVWPAKEYTRGPERSATQPSVADGNDFDEGPVWHQMAEWRLGRNEASAALLDFTQAEAQGKSARAKGEARIGQARSLIAMGQSSPAMAILSVVVQQPDSVVSCHALAIIGVISLQQGRTTEGLNLLQRAVDNPDHARWSGFSQAQADLALACLAVGKEKEGLLLLHEAQTAFAGEGRTADLCQCLSTEAAYLQKTGHPDRAESRIRKIAELENQPPLVKETLGIPASR